MNAVVSRFFIILSILLEVRNLRTVMVTAVVAMEEEEITVMVDKRKCQYPSTGTQKEGLNRKR